MALQGRIVHLWVTIESSPRRCDSSALLHLDTELPGVRNPKRILTCRTSCSAIQCSTSILFKKTNRLAPIKRWQLLVGIPRIVLSGDKPLPRAIPPAPDDNHQLEADRWHPRPTLECLFSQSNSSSRTEVFFVPRRPLEMVSLATNPRGRFAAAHRC